MLQHTRLVNPPDIEHELAVLRREMAIAPDGRAVLPASVHNLLIMCRAVAADTVGSAAAVVGSNPGRVIVLREGNGDRDRLAAEIGALRAGEQEPSYAEYVKIEAAGGTAQYLPELALPLLVSSVPTVLWWSGAVPLDDLIFQRMATLADRILVDTARSADPLADLTILARLSAERGRWIGLGDLAWARVTPWRQLTAQFFDTPAARSSLTRLDHVEISYGTGKAPIGALLYVGWLASRLRWRLDRVEHAEGEWTVRYLHGGRGITVALQPHDAYADIPGAMGEVKITTGGHHPLRFRVQRMADRVCLKTDAGTDGLLLGSRIVEMPEQDDGGLLRDEMTRIYRNTVYHAALAEAARLGQI